MKYRLSLGALIFILILWFSLSTGGLYKLSQINPDYPVRDKNLANLISNLNNKISDHWDVSTTWYSYHVKRCYPYMPNWKKANDCVATRVSCEYVAPKDSLGVADVFSEIYISCVNERLSYGIMEWLRVSRGIFRAGISFAILKVSDVDVEYKNGKQKDWDYKNKWWIVPLKEWTEQGG